MSESKEIASEEAVTGKESSSTESFLNAFGAYQWVAWFVVLEIALLGLAVILDMVLGAYVLAGILGAFAVLVGGTGVVTLLTLVLYRAAFGGT